jgi:hypothetical protein
MLSFACCAASPIWIVLPGLSKTCGIRKSYTLDRTPESSPQLQPLRTGGASISSVGSDGPMVLNLQVLFSFGRQNSIQRKVRRRVLHLGTAFILSLCIWGHVSELFDHWDNTFRTGNDIEYSTVIVALVAGAAICLAGLATLLIAFRTTIASTLSVFAMESSDVPTTGSFVAHSPPIPLRI